MKTQAAEGTRSGEAQKVIPIEQTGSPRLQLAMAAFRSGYSLLSVGMVLLVAKSGRRLFASAYGLSARFMRLAGKLQLSEGSLLRVSCGCWQSASSAESKA